MPEQRPLAITATIDGRAVPRSEVLAWEADRAAKVARKLDVERRGDDLGALRDALVARKLELGHVELERRFRRDIALTSRASRLITALSRGRSRVCTVELAGPEGSAEAVSGFYKRAMERGDEAPLLAACPDHHLLAKLDPEEEQVMESIGGSPLVSRVLLAAGDPGMLTTPADPEFPVQWLALGRAAPDHPFAGGIRHQFSDGPAGFRARLAGEFPIGTPKPLLAARRWHLACEFSNWIEMAAA